MNETFYAILQQGRLMIKISSFLYLFDSDQLLILCFYPQSIIPGAIKNDFKSRKFGEYSLSLIICRRCFCYKLINHLLKCWFI